MYREPGSICTYRYVIGEEVLLAMPVRVVEDDPDLSALYIAAGSPLKARVAPDGASIPRDIPYAERHRIPMVIGDRQWQSNDGLILIRPGDAYDIRVFWSAETGEFEGWYVNLQTPIVRNDAGFESSDHILDITVAPDRSWKWKDEHEIVDAVDVGRFSHLEADAIRAAGERVVEDIEAWRWPFNAGYENWRPDPAWEIPELPNDWNTLTRQGDD